MKQDILKSISDNLKYRFTEDQVEKISEIISVELSKYDIQVKLTDVEEVKRDNQNLVNLFLSAKCIEGCSDKTIHYYQTSIEKLLISISKEIRDINTNDIRCYLAEQQNEKQLSKVTIDNLRRIFSSFFSWLEDEDYIVKSPVRRIHKVKTESYVKDTLSDEDLEKMRDCSSSLRDLAMLDLLISTGIRVGELVGINRSDLNFQERQCVVFGKGNKERLVYFNARAKIHLEAYLRERKDNNPALFVGLYAPYKRLQISGVERRIKQLGARAGIGGVHPHKFRRTMATMAIDKGMPIEQVQRLLGNVRIDTTLH